MKTDELNAKWMRNDAIPSFLGIGKRTWQKIRMSGEIPFSKRGHVIFVATDDLNTWLEKNKTVNTNK